MAAAALLHGWRREGRQSLSSWRWCGAAGCFAWPRACIHIAALGGKVPRCNAASGRSICAPPAAGDPLVLHPRGVGAVEQVEHERLAGKGHGEF